MPSVTGKGLRPTSTSSTLSPAVLVSMPSVTGKGLRLARMSADTMIQASSFNALRNGQGSATALYILNPALMTAVSMPSVTGKGLRLLSTKPTPGLSAKFQCPP